jgi:uncharacterized repeat protein (TIGR03803 family)
MRTRLLLALLFLSVAASAQTYTFSTLVSFPPAAKKGPQVPEGVILDAAGNIYGVSIVGGTNGFGTVFKVTPKGALTVLYNFAGGSDGAGPIGNLVRDKAGNFYGVTSAGGVTASCEIGCGTIFKVTPAGKESVLYRFTGGADGSGPNWPVTLDAAGNLYGYNFNTHSSDEGDGIIYKLTPDGAFSIVYTFCSLSNCADGSIPSGSLIFDMSGNAYGVTSLGGAFNLGTVFKLTPEGVESVLFSFPGGSNGEVPVFKLTQDAAGTMYGTALGGASNSGILFAITPAGEFSVFYSFACLPENCAVDPQSLSPLTLDSGGNLYGTYILNVGTQVQEIFKVTPAGAESVPYVAGPAGLGLGPIVLDKAGNLYGSTVDGGPSHLGSVFKLTRNAD